MATPIEERLDRLSRLARELVFQYGTAIEVAEIFDKLVIRVEVLETAPPGSGDMLVSVYDPATKSEQLLGISDLLDEDDFISDSDTKAPTQQSTAQYIADQTAGFITSVDANDIIPLSSDFTYNLDGSINTVTKDGLVKTFAYNLDGSIDTVIDLNFTKTFAYNLDGSIDSVTVT